MDTKTVTIAKSETLVFDLILGLTAFSIPFFVSGPQLLTGSVVNTLLFIASARLSAKRLIPIVILPSIAAVSRGFLFGPLTLLLLYFMPFIWISNSILILVSNYLSDKTNNIIRIILSASLKSLFLFTLAQIYFKFHIVPKVFLTSMGLIQFTTAIIGGFIALFILRILKKYE